jgi:galactose mutarotase-like enzyme
VQGGESPATGEDAVYRAEEAVGWDECFPTVAPWDASGTSWGRRLRDHGDIWGRPWRVADHSTTSLTTSYEDQDFRFTRRLALEGNTLLADYSVDNLSSRELPYLWALHGLLAVTPEDRILIDDLDSVTATYLSIGGKTIAKPQLSWPGPDPALGFALDQVQPAEAAFAGKFYASHLPRPLASVGGRNGWLDIAWNNDEIAHLGLWFNYGGWPKAGALRHIALEPTCGPDDHLGQSLDRGTAAILEPRAAKSWRVTLTLRPDTPTP